MLTMNEIDREEAIETLMDAYRQEALADDTAEEYEIDLAQQLIALCCIRLLSEAVLDVAVDQPVDHDLERREAQSDAEQQREQQPPLQRTANPLTEHDSQSLDGSR